MKRKAAELAESEAAATPAKRKVSRAAAGTVKRPAGKKAGAPAISRADIALRAYYIAEKRHREGLPGNEHLDWIEAEKQLSREIRARTVAKRAAS